MLLIEVLHIVMGRTIPMSIADLARSLLRTPRVLLCNVAFIMRYINEVVI